jgi:hypothetical protein
MYCYRPLPAVTVILPIAAGYLFHVAKSYMPRRKRVTEGLDPDLEAFFQDLQTNYSITREQFLDAIAQFGMIKPRIRTYFLVQAHLQKRKGKQGMDRK